jgi:hypothetical protein
MLRLSLDCAQPDPPHLTAGAMAPSVNVTTASVRHYAYSCQLSRVVSELLQIHKIYKFKI